MIRRSFLLAAALAAVTILPLPVCAQDSAPFYAGKTVRVLVGTSPGGGYDIYTRLFARHIGKHIAGNPTVSLKTRRVRAATGRHGRSMP